MKTRKILIRKLLIAIFVTAVLPFNIHAKESTTFKNLALGQTITTSSAYSDEYDGAKAVDGDMGTRWSAHDTDDKPTLTVEFGQSVPFDTIVIRENKELKRVAKFSISCLQEEERVILYEGTKMDAEHTVKLDIVVTGSAISLSVLEVTNTDYDDTGSVNIDEFEVYHTSYIDTENDDLEENDGLEDVEDLDELNDYTNLQKMIEQAKILLKKIEVGITPGKYSKELKDLLLDVIRDSESLDHMASQVEVKQAIEKLQDVIKSLIDSLVKGVPGDINEDGKVNIADIALATYYYQTKLGDINWEEIKIIDVNGDNKIDIEDIRIIVSKF